jgi:hypothetical protein
MALFYNQTKVKSIGNFVQILGWIFKTNSPPVAVPIPADFGWERLLPMLFGQLQEGM